MTLRPRLVLAGSVVLLAVAGVTGLCRAPMGATPAAVPSRPLPDLTASATPPPAMTRPGLSSIEPLAPIPGGVTGAACARVTLTGTAAVRVRVTVTSSDANVLRVLGNVATVPDGQATALVRCDTASPPGPVAVTLSAFLGADSASTVVTVS